MEKSKQKISREVAEQEFIKFCDSWNIDTDEEDFDDEERQDYKTQKRKIIRAIRASTIMYFIIPTVLPLRQLFLDM